MNVKETALKWGVSEGRVRTYCRYGFVDNASKIQGGTIWNIPDNAWCPLYFKQNKADTQLERKGLVLQAIDQRKVIPYEKLRGDYNLVMTYFDQLCEIRLIEKSSRISKTKDPFMCYVLTPRGEKFMNEKKSLQAVCEELAPLIVAVSEGITRGLVAQ